MYSVFFENLRIHLYYTKMHGLKFTQNASTCFKSLEPNVIDFGVPLDWSFFICKYMINLKLFLQKGNDITHLKRR